MPSRSSWLLPDVPAPDATQLPITVDHLPVLRQVIVGEPENPFKHVAVHVLLTALGREQEKLPFPRAAG